MIFVEGFALGDIFWKTFLVLIFVGFARGDIIGRQGFALGDIWKAFLAVIFVEGFAWGDIFGCFPCSDIKETLNIIIV